MQLRDPASLTEFHLSPPERCGWRYPIYEPAAYGYCATMTYNAKNAYGGYAGAKAYRILYRDRIVTRQVEIYPE